MLDRFLAVLRGIADIIRSRSLNVWKTFAQARDNFLRVVKAECGLGQKRQPLRIINLESIHGFDAIHYNRLLRGLARRPYNFLMIAVADQDYRSSFPRNFNASR